MITRSLPRTAALRGLALGLALLLAASAQQAYGAGVATNLAFLSQPADAIVNNPIPQFQVAVQDNLGRTVTVGAGSTDAIQVLLYIGGNPDGGVLQGTQTVNAVKGVATFSGLTINTAGIGYTLKAQDNTQPSPLVADSLPSKPFNINGVPAKLAFVAQPGTTIAGAIINPVATVTVAVLDASGNTVTSLTGATITMAIGAASPPGTLTGGTSATTSSGVATFSNLSIDTAGVAFTLTASSGSLTPATSTPFDIQYELAFTAQPGNATSVTPISAVQVAVQDAKGNTISAASNPITLSIGPNSPGNGTLSGTLTEPAVNGVATFNNLGINKVGTGYTLAASAAGVINGTGIQGGISQPFNILPGPASQLAFVTQPSNAVVGTPFSPAVQVAVQDAVGNLVPTAFGSITIVLGNNISSGSVTGTTSVATAGGVATFNNLSVDTAQNGYVLAASSPGLASATSNVFNVRARAPTVASLSPATGVTTGGTNVVVNGAYFAGVGTVTVTFGGVPATNVIVVSATQLNVTAPPFAQVTAVDVVVTNPDGQFGTLASGFNYILPIPVITSPTTITTTFNAVF
ncbi:MAG: IPT/TIG domain-containing protein, partial [Planctomycetota bacterium]